MLKKYIFVVLAVVSLSACTYMEPDTNSNLLHETNQSVQSKIQIGSTTKSEILAAFGEPKQRSLLNGNESFYYFTNPAKAYLHVVFNGDVVELYNFNMH